MSSLAYDFDQHGHLVPVPDQMPRSEARVAKPAPVKEPAQARPTPHAPLPHPLAPPPTPADLALDRGRDDLLTAFGKATLEDRYLMPGESYQDMNRT